MKKKHERDRRLRNFFILISVMAVGAMIYWVGVTRRPSVETAQPSVAEQAARTQSQTAVPPFYTGAKAAKPYPKLIPAVYYQRYPLVKRAYQDAAEIPGVLAQQPCYCYCDRVGHRSLLDCYASNHAAG